MSSGKIVTPLRTGFMALESQQDIDNTPTNLLLDVPIDLKEKFESDLVNQIRDTAGRPTTSESKFIQNEKLITDIFIPELRNVIANIKCDSKDNPEGLIWNKIHETQGCHKVLNASANS